MSALRLLSTAGRRVPKALPQGRRGYAEVADKIKLSLVLPHQVRHESNHYNSDYNFMPTLLDHLLFHRCCSSQLGRSYW